MGPLIRHCTLWIFIPDRVSNYTWHEAELDFTGVEFPASLKDVSKVRFFDFCAPFVLAFVLVFLLAFVLAFGLAFALAFLLAFRLAFWLEFRLCICACICASICACIPDCICICACIHGCICLCACRWRKTTISISTFSAVRIRKVYPLRLSNEPQQAINLLLLEEDRKTHWMWIKDFNRLCHDKTNRRCRDFYCMRCLSRHHSQENLEKHLVDCGEFHYCRTNMLKPGSTVKFINHHKQLKAPYVSRVCLVLLDSINVYGFVLFVHSWCVVIHRVFMPLCADHLCRLRGCCESSGCPGASRTQHGEDIGAPRLLGRLCRHPFRRGADQRVLSQR